MKQAIDIQGRARLAARWLIRSMEVTGNQGSSAFYAPWRYPLRGWAPAYPETTGYLIATLLAADGHFPEWSLRARAGSCSRWLLNVQLEDGSFPALFGKKPKPSIFNTGQILMGLLDWMQEEEGPAFEGAAAKAARWLARTQEADGAWRQAAYVEGFVPTYYARVAWPLLRAAAWWEDEELWEAGVKAVRFLRTRLGSGFQIESASFYPGKKAFTHTLAYALRGFWESALLLGDEALKEEIALRLEWLFSQKEPQGRLAGRYSQAWEGDYSFVCLTGNAQFSVLLYRVARYTGDSRFADWAEKALDPVLQAQVLSGNPQKRGAIPGSSPFLGAYMPGRYPNWAAKFFLDACLERLSISAALSQTP